MVDQTSARRLGAFFVPKKPVSPLKRGESRSLNLGGGKRLTANVGVDGVVRAEMPPNNPNDSFEALIKGKRTKK